jgi:hypothetical protein
MQPVSHKYMQHHITTEMLNKDITISQKMHMYMYNKDIRKNRIYLVHIEDLDNAIYLNISTNTHVKQNENIHKI